MWGAIAPKESVVEIIKANDVKDDDSIVVVDVAGYVMNPGVYKLPSSSRIGDALVAAGGLSASADRDWVAKTINLAEKVKDGGKIYIPAKVVTKVTGEVEGESVSEAVVNNGKVNINTASESELDSLVGIGEVRAKAIIEGRPYASTEELMSNAKISQSVYEGIKDQVSVY